MSLSNTTMLNDFSWSSPYPPIINLDEIVSSHDRPFAEFGNIGIKVLRSKFNFELPEKKKIENEKSNNNKNNFGKKVEYQHFERINAVAVSATSITKTSKEKVLSTTLKSFKEGQIRYICVSSEIDDHYEEQRLNLQIIFNYKVNRTTPFLEYCTSSDWKYRVASCDRQWNEYLKRGLQFVEYGLFKSKMPHKSHSWDVWIRKRKRNNDDDVGNSSRRQKIDDEMATEVISLAENNVCDAMELVKDKVPAIYLTQCAKIRRNCEIIANEVRLKQMQETGLQKEFRWPSSFSGCTTYLRRAVNYWILNYFLNPQRALCLILIGGTGTGKTAFAKSLPGTYNYFKGSWNLESWNDKARYLIIDDVPWDKFDTKGYPEKKTILTCNDPTFADDKYMRSKSITVKMPAIVLLNPEDAGSLITEADNQIGEYKKNYWSDRAFIYVMGPHEYFYKQNRPDPFDPEDSKYDRLDHFEEFKCDNNDKVPISNETDETQDSSPSCSSSITIDEQHIIDLTNDNFQSTASTDDFDIEDIVTAIEIVEDILNHIM